MILQNHAKSFLKDLAKNKILHDLARSCYIPTKIFNRMITIDRQSCLTVILHLSPHDMIMKHANLQKVTCMLKRMNTTQYGCLVHFQFQANINSLSHFSIHKYSMPIKLYSSGVLQLRKIILIFSNFVFFSKLFLVLMKCLK